MSELNYKAINIAKAEAKHQANLFKVLEGFGEESPSLSNILFVLEAGGLNEEQAGDLVDDKGLVESIKLAVESLTSAGFLANSVNKAEVQKALDQAETSASIGETKKA